jgi:hypothetical protein
MTDLTLTDLRATIAALDAADMEPVERARQSTRIACTAVTVAFAQGAITQEMATRLTDALAAVLAELETA